MKKLLLVAAMAVFAGANAQMQKGSWVVGASTNLGFNSVNTNSKATFGGVTVEEDATVNTFNVNPSVGYFVMDNLAVGLDFGYTNASQKEDDYKFITSMVSVMPNATYYFYNEGNFIPYLGAGAGYAAVTYKEKESGSSYSETYDGFAWKGKGGVVYLINKNLGLDLGLSYTQFNNKETDTVMGSTVTQKNKVGTFGVNVGFSIFLGKGKNANNAEVK